ncbi:MAG: hypothetical protein IJR34_05135 [Bacteroidales bacterium]|nr:hypothetical protein [Bacteroidales bacterium]
MMRKFAWFITFVLLLCGGSLAAQDMRTVRGMVAAPDGHAIPNATLKADGVDTPFKANRVGQFEIKVPFSCQKLTAYVDGYSPLTLDISGNFLLFNMKPDAPAESVAPVAAGSAAAGAAQAEAVATAQEQAEKEALARAKAEREAREKAEAEAKAKAQAKAKAEQEAKAKQSAQAQAGTQRFKERGLMHSFDFSYAYQFYSGQIVYVNSGIRNYSSLHPLQLTYSIGWRFSRMFSVSGGIGFLYNTVSLERNGDHIETELYGDKTPRRFDIPVFVNGRCHFGNGLVLPYLTLSGGIYAMSLAPLLDIGIGASFRLGGPLALNLAVSARNTPWPRYTRSGFEGYPFYRIVPAVTLGVSF